MTSSPASAPRDATRRAARLQARRLANRTSRRTAVIATGVALGILATAGVTAAAPASQADASGTTPSFALASFSTPLDITSTVAPVGLVDAAKDAEAQADEALTAALDVSAAVKDAGLDVKGASSVDTGELEGTVAKLTTTFILTKDDVAAVAEAIDAVEADTEDLSTRLAAAKKAEEERIAAEKARQEAEAKAAAEAAAAAAAAKAQAAASASASAPTPTPVASTGDNSPGGAQATARSMMAERYGWGDDQFACLVALWNKESGWNVYAYNAGSGAYGIPQALPGSKMATAGADWQSSAATQISWGLGYIAGRYGNPCGAWGHSQSTGWY